MISFNQGGKPIVFRLWRQQRDEDGKPWYREQDDYQLNLSRFEWIVGSYDDKPSDYRLILYDVHHFPDWALLLDASERWTLTLHQNGRTLYWEPLIESVELSPATMLYRLNIELWGTGSFEKEDLLDP